MEELDINIGNDEQSRQAYRTRVPGFEVKILESGMVYGVKDLSVSGFAVEDKEGVFTQGNVCEVEFYLNKKLFLGGAQAVVMRVMNQGIVGFTFQDLDRRQVIKLDKLVLEVQKRLIQLRKAKAEE